MQIKIADISTQRIFLGWTGENKHIQFAYDFADVFAEYPDAGVGLTIQPPTGDAYPHTITRDGNTVLWEILSSDCAVVGDGVYQFTFTQGETVAKSLKGFYTVKESLTGSGEAPTPVQNWIADAEAALYALTGMAARAVTLAPGSSATATIVEENGHKVIVIGVPEGLKGDTGATGATGATPDITIGTVTTLAPGADATVTITGTQESPVLNFGIPQGVQGAKGDKGDTGATGAKGDKGEKGDQGPQGIQGEKGDKGDKGDTGEKGDPGTPGDPSSLIDDNTTTATNKTWSAAKINEEFSDLNSALNDIGDDVESLQVDKADVIVSSASGAIASFPDGADGMPVKELTVSIEPVQDLHGYDAPWPGGGGKNLWDENWENGTFDVTTGADIDYTVGQIRAKNRISVTPSTMYYFVNGGMGAGWFIFYDSDGNVITDGLPDGSRAGNCIALNNTAFITPVNCYAVRFYITDAYGATYNNNIAINYPSTVTTYSPYSNLCPISGFDCVDVWGDPAYGGNIEWNQQLANGNFEDSTGWGAGKGTLTVADNVATVTANSTVTTNVELFEYPISHKVVGHKYLYTLEFKPSISLGRVSIQGMAVIGIYKTFPANAWANAGLVFTCTSDSLIDIYFFAESTFAEGNTVQIKNSMLFDLTQMFGAGNEPSTVEEFKALFPADYYSYNTGEVTTVSAVNGDPYKHVEIEFPSSAGTVYGGSLTVNEDGTGRLVVDRMFIELDGTEAGWTKYSTQTCYNSNLAVNTLTSSTEIIGICSHVKNKNNGSIDPTYLAHVNSYRGLEFRLLTDYWGLANNDVSTWTAYLAAQKTAGTPVQVAAYLKEPTTVQFTAQQLNTLLGQNNIWASTGDTTVTYRADTKLYIDNRITQAIAAAVAAL